MSQWLALCGVTVHLYFLLHTVTVTYRNTCSLPAYMPGA